MAMQNLGKGAVWKNSRGLQGDGLDWGQQGECVALG